MSLPVIDMAPLFGREEAPKQALARRIARACEEVGFFYVCGHRIRTDLMERLDAAARAFFALPTSEKARIDMARAGGAWRGWFGLHGELTSGRPDDKEGLYFGDELEPDDPRVRAGWLLHGANQWPSEPAELKPAVAAYVAEVSRVAEVLIQGVSLALGLDAQHFQRTYLAEPTRLFRIFHYPPTAPGAWGVGEHTDYGLLTLLLQDEIGGLEVKGRRGWLSAPPIAGTLVCNIGDMLERLTGGRFVSTPHRVVNTSGKSRLSYPFFYDPDFTAMMTPVSADQPIRSCEGRWDQEDLYAFQGAYGDYLAGRVGRVFPDLKAAVSTSSPGLIRPA